MDSHRDYLLCPWWVAIVAHLESMAHGLDILSSDWTVNRRTRRPQPLETDCLHRTRAQTSVAPEPTEQVRVAIHVLDG